MGLNSLIKPEELESLELDELDSGPVGELEGGSVAVKEPGPELAQVGGEVDGPTKSLLRLQRAAQIHQTETDNDLLIYSAEPIPVEEPDVERHVELVELRGAKRSYRRTLYVTASPPVQVLPLDAHRRRAVISVVGASNDGWYCAFGSEALYPFNWNFPGGALTPPPVQAASTYLVPCNFTALQCPTGYVYESIEELYAVFVPDTSIANAGQACIVSIEVEVGDKKAGTRSRRRGAR